MTTQAPTSTSQEQKYYIVQFEFKKFISDSYKRLFYVKNFNFKKNETELAMSRIPNTEHELVYSKFGYHNFEKYLNNTYDQIRIDSNVLDKKSGIDTSDVLKQDEISEYNPTHWHATIPHYFRLRLDNIPDKLNYTLLKDNDTYYSQLTDFNLTIFEEYENSDELFNDNVVYHNEFTNLNYNDSGSVSLDITVPTDKPNNPFNHNDYIKPVSKKSNHIVLIMIIIITLLVGTAFIIPKLKK
jgi:hypothetical protein